MNRQVTHQEKKFVIRVSDEGHTSRIIENPRNQQKDKTTKKIIIIIGKTSLLLNTFSEMTEMFYILFWMVITRLYTIVKLTKLIKMNT